MSVEKGGVFEMDLFLSSQCKIEEGALGGAAG